MPGDLVQHDQCGLIPDELFEQSSPGRCAVPFAFLGQGISLCSSQLVGQFPPQCISPDVIFFVVETRGRIQVRADDASYPYLSWLRQEGRIHHPIYHFSRDLAVGSMVEADQVVRLAAAKGGLQADDGVVRRFCPCQPAQGFVEEEFQSLCGIGVVKVGGWVLVHGIRFAVNDILQAGGKDLLPEFPF